MIDSYIAIVNQDSLGIIDTDTLDLQMNPEKTIYDMKIKNVKSGDIVLCFFSSYDNHCLVSKEGEFFWLLEKYLTPA